MDAAEAVTDRMVSRELYAKGIATKVQNQLSALEAALVADLAAALARLSGKDEARLLAGNYTTDRLKRMIAQVQQFSIDWADIVQTQLETGAIDLIQAEIEFEQRFVAAYAGDAAITIALDANITPQQVFTAARRRPMETKVMKEVFPEMSRNVKRRVVESLRASYQAGDSVGQAMTRMRSDSELGINRRGAEGLVRTGLAHYASNATLDALKALGVEKVEWVSTLDSRTTAICRSLDRRVFDINDAKLPLPPRHFRCRSAIVAHFEDLPDGRRAARDSEGNGTTVPASMNYEEWLRKQPKGFAREILGETQYKIWSTGVPVSKFTDKYATREFTATELRARYASLFDDERAKAA